MLLVLALIVLHRPLAEWLWPDSRVEVLLQQGQQALQQGRLSAADGSGARQLFAAAQALDSDRPEASAGLARTGEAALQLARKALAEGQLERADKALRLAKALEVPQLSVQRVQQQLRQQRAQRAGLEQMLQQAAQARQQGRLDEGPDSALPLYQQILQLAPERIQALEGREDALTELLQRAWQGLRREDLLAAAPLLRAARKYDPGHAELPAAEAEFNRLLDQHRQRAEAALASADLAAAEQQFQLLLQALPDDTAAADGLRRVQAARAEPQSKPAEPAQPQRAQQRAQARACFDQALQANQLHAAGVCLQRWQPLAAGSERWQVARRRLAQRWLEVGSEQLRAGNIAVAQEALQQAQQLDSQTPGLSEFANRLKRALRR